MTADEVGMTLQDIGDKCLVLAALCFGGAAVIHAVQIAKRRERNRYVLAVSSGADDHMQWEFFDSRGEAELAYDKVHSAATKVLLDVRDREGPVRGVVRKSGEKSAVERTLEKLRTELALTATSPTSNNGGWGWGGFL